MKKIFRWLLILPLLTSFIFGEVSSDTMYNCVNSTVNQRTTQVGGVCLPCTGTINVLIIFAQFPDDKYDINNLSWPKGCTPINPINGDSIWIDQDWSTSPTIGSLTHYFNEMSFNKLHFIGNTVSVITPHSREWYLNNNKTRYDIHKEIIQQLDLKMDFSKYDNWYFQNFYNFKNEPDRKVEFVIFVWRNIALEYPSTQRSNIYNTLDMNLCGNIGGSINIWVDNGKREILTGHLQGGGGATIIEYFSVNAFRFIIHEYAHYMEGSNRMHCGFGFWGMLSAWGIKNFVANSYEREILGWGDPITITGISSGIKKASLKDFITSGEAYKLVINNITNENFYLENHQNISYWENKGLEGIVEKGIYIIRKDGFYGDQMQVIPADGRYAWEVNQLIDNPWGKGQLPVFKKLASDRKNGYHDLQLIPWNWEELSQSPEPIHFIENSNGKPQLNVKFRGDGNDAFRLGYQEIWSPYSNPNSQSANGLPTPYGFKLNSINNDEYSIDIYVNTSQAAPPSKPQNINLGTANNRLKLSWDANIEPDIAGYYIYKQINTGNFVEIAFVSQEEKISYSYMDNQTLTDLANEKVTYFIKAKDKDSLLSTSSDSVKLAAMPITPITKTVLSNHNFYLEQNYPNPFNPITKIRYQVPATGLVSLRIYNLQGEVVTTLVNEERSVGTYVVGFNAIGLASGVYFYQLKVSNFTETKKMLLLK